MKLCMGNDEIWLKRVMNFTPQALRGCSEYNAQPLRRLNRIENNRKEQKIEQKRK